VKDTSRLPIVLFGLLSIWALAVPIDARAQEAPKVNIPEPGVPEILTIQGKFIRAAYNNEGYVILGYQPANRSVGEEWMLIEVGITLRDGVPDFVLTRAALSLETPDGKTLPLPSVSEFRAASTQALQNRARVQRDTINYFPPTATIACRLGFFSDLEDSAAAWDQVELSSNRGCLGRLYFQVPGGIQYGQHWLNVKFEKSLVRVPFRILTADEEKLLSKHYKSISKQVKEAFKKK
jgi:hypothetical protein